MKMKKGKCNKEVLVEDEEEGGEQEDQKEKDKGGVDAASYDRKGPPSACSLLPAGGLSIGRRGAASVYRGPKGWEFRGRWVA